MGKKIIRLANAVHWDNRIGDKQYLESVQLVVTQHPFAMRQVFIRFSGGPAIDLSIYDMDRFVKAYLTLRGLKTPIGRTRSKKPFRCDFSVDCHRES